MVRSSCKSCVLQHPINISHIINSRKLQKIKMITTTANQNEKITKRNLADQRPTLAVGMPKTENARERMGQETVRNPPKITESEEQER
jgi:hypothetical protein